jgi:hypothetical protein
MSKSTFSRRSKIPYTVNTLDELPEGLRERTLQKLEPGAEIDTIFVVPMQQLASSFGVGRRTSLVPESALVFTDHGVLFVSDDGSEEKSDLSVYITHDQFSFLRLTLILLYGRLDLWGTQDNQPVKIEFVYNATGHELLQPVLHRFLHRSWVGQKGILQPIPPENEKVLAELFQQALKFSNGLRNYGLQRNERLLGYAFQPRIVKRFLGLFPKISVPGCVAAFSENGFVLMQEGSSNATSYGWFITICHKRLLSDVEISAGEKMSTVAIQIKAGAKTEMINLEWEHQHAEELKSLWLAQSD